MLWLCALELCSCKWCSREIRKTLLAMEPEIQKNVSITFVCDEAFTINTAIPESVKIGASRSHASVILSIAL